MSIKPLSIEEFTEKTGNVHEAIVVASKRARTVNNDLKIQFNQQIETIVTKTEVEGEENDINPDQLKISLEFEKRPKPTDVALEEIMAGKLQWRYKEPDPVVTTSSEDEE
jgi:DNA-directed RNA polymerase omega subunit